MVRILRTATLCLLTLSAPVSALAAGGPIDWNAQRTEILAHYRALVQLDTTNPPGNEITVVNYLKKALEAEGIRTETFALDSNRPNLVARLKGNGSKRPLLILAHTDVVPVQRDKWPVDPFGAVMKDGYVWGRGSRDDKPLLAAELMVMLLLKRTGAVLDRDVIFLAEPGEEADVTGVGINFMVDKHFDAIDAEFAITEGGAALLDGSRVSIVNIGTAEKVPARVRLVATGQSGHGSVPLSSNALIHLGAAVDKVGRWNTPVRLNETTHTYFERLAATSPPELAAIYRALLGPQPSPESVRYLAEHDPSRSSMLRTSVVPTMMKAGIGPNVIPSEAEATLDIRALPDENIRTFYAEMEKVIADPSVKIVPLPVARPFSPASSLTTEMYRTLEQISRTLYPGVTVLPTMSTGASDMAQLRAKGIPSYGIGPAAGPEDQNYGAHSDVERLLESSLYRFVEFTWTAVTSVSARR
jgi:acetylornithine deacetylase/succinyl-diaminopimelate desuccinylase-like protein